MVETSYRVIPRTKHRFDVEMAKPNGSRKIIEGFVSEHEANAWIVQAQRMIRATGPWTPRKPADTRGPPVLPSLQSEQERLQNARNRAATKRANVKAARERTGAKS